jgi:hypothetical protein
MLGQTSTWNLQIVREDSTAVEDTHVPSSECLDGRTDGRTAVLLLVSSHELNVCQLVDRR